MCDTRVLITGGAGYLGSIIVPELLNSGYDVVVIDNFMYNQSSLLDACNNNKLTVVRGDARDSDLIKKLMEGAEYILPLACLTGAPLCSQDTHGAQTINFDAVKMLLDIRNSYQKIIFPTTNSGYGVGQKGIYCTEETPLHPISLYGRLKVEIEKLLLESGNCITLRLATVFGVSPRMRFDLLVNDFTYRAITDKYLVLFESHFKRNYIHIRDVAKAFKHCMRNFDDMKNETYNVGLSDANLSKWELCEEIKQQVPDFYFTEAGIGEDPDKRDYIVSNEKIEATGYKPDFSIQMGISELIKGYQIVRNKNKLFCNV